MITKNISFVPEITPFSHRKSLLSGALFFDIETTGLSAADSFVYMIGCAHLSDRTASSSDLSFSLTQWICTDITEEKELLSLFFQKASLFQTLVHYNGTVFDIPFLQKKARKHQLTCPFTSLQSIDLYAEARKLKKNLSLSDLKQKSLEVFFSLSRTDTFSGGDLIAVNAKFIGLHKINSLTGNRKQEEETALLNVLLLHNEEDVKNLPSLSILEALSHLDELILPDSLSVRKNEAALTFSINLRVSFPGSFRLSFPWEEVSVSMFFSSKNRFSLILPVYSGERKRFYEPVSDYFYIPSEDTALHKSVALFLSKESRVKATKATCYTRHSGTFIPFPEQKKTNQQANEESCLSALPYLKAELKSKVGFTPLTDELLTNPNIQMKLFFAFLSSLLPIVR